MHPRGFTASAKSRLKSRPGNLLSSAWCFWIVHECAYHVQAKDGFQFLCLYGRFSKIRSHILNEASYYSIDSLYAEYANTISNQHANFL